MEPTFSPAMMHSDSVSTALDSLKHLSRVLPISVATLEGLNMQQYQNWCHINFHREKQVSSLTFQSQMLVRPWVRALC